MSEWRNPSLASWHRVPTWVFSCLLWERARPTTALPPGPRRGMFGATARIDQGGPIFVGANTSGIRMTGRLYLSVNDDHLPDNTSEFRVVVEVQRTSTR